MGCDIHLHQEVKINGVWHHYRHRSVERSYKLFSLMAGVRGDEEPVAEPKGLPVDMTFLTQYDYDPDDCHTPSWLDATEIKKVLERFFQDNRYDAEDWFGYLFGNSWIGFLTYPDSRPDGLEDIRWVFWFDN